jgi:dihydroneopterin aldolase
LEKKKHLNEFKLALKLSGVKKDINLYFSPFLKVGWGDSNLKKRITKTLRMSVISIEGMEFFAYHGCFKEEAIIGTKFRIDLFLRTDTRKAEVSDDLDDTVNYQKVYAFVKEEMLSRSKLLEHVGRRILHRIKKEFPEVNQATIKIRKLNPPLGGKMDFVAVELEL